MPVSVSKVRLTSGMSFLEPMGSSAQPRWQTNLAVAPNFVNLHLFEEFVGRLLPPGATSARKRRWNPTALAPTRRRATNGSDPPVGTSANCRSRCTAHGAGR